MNKVFTSFDEAVADIFDGATVMVGGGCQRPRGVPRNLLLALQRKGVRNLTLITPAGSRGGMTIGPDGKPKLLSIVGYTRFPHAENWLDHDILTHNRQVKKIICSIAFIPGRETVLQKMYEAGEVEMEQTGHGTLATRIWAGGAGIGGFYCPVGVGTLLEEGKEKRIIDGKEYLFETPLKADFALIWAYKADKIGNLVYRGTSRQFAPLMAKAAKVTIAEVYEILEPGELDPESIVTPGIYVHRIIQTPEEDKR
jgi:3-oxoacid CoA-transferase A subunit